MTLTLPAKLQDFVEGKVAAGAYPSEADVICEALGRMMGTEEDHARMCARFSEAIDVGWEQAKAGQLRSMDDVLARLEERKQRWAAKQAGR